MEEKISAVEMLKTTASLIEEIIVPVKLADQIARPLCQAVANINAVIEAYNKQQEEGEQDV